MRKARSAILATLAILSTAALAACDGDGNGGCEPGQIRLPNGTCVWPGDGDADADGETDDTTGDDGPDDVPGDRDGDAPDLPDDADIPDVPDGETPPCERPCEEDTDCDDSNVCTVEACAPLTSCCALLLTPEGGYTTDGLPCGDETYCNGADYCVEGVCFHEDVNCTSDSLCKTASCDEANDTCAISNLPNGTSCDDGLYCTGPSNLCQDGDCLYGNPCPVFTGNPCTRYDCLETEPHCVETARDDWSPCPDADPCDGTEYCMGGSCSFVDRACFDGDPCTQDTCDPGTGGCSHAAVPGCTDCSGGTDCVDTDVCTTDYCQDVGGTITCDFYTIVGCG
jgi:hypothetical protein